MKRWLVAIVLLILVAGSLYLFRPAQPPAAGEREKPKSSSVSPFPGANPPIATQTWAQTSIVETASNIPLVQNNLSSSNPTSAVPESPQPGASYVEGPKLPASTLLENMRTAIRDYGSMFGGNPVGNNAEITRALNGDNPKQARFISPESGLRINGKGELIDPWGSPLFFHQLSANETEIRSAGPDKTLWTPDDIVVK
jgi:hypothetical protein